MRTLPCSHLTALGLGDDEHEMPSRERDEAVAALVQALAQLHSLDLNFFATDAGLQ